MCYGDLPTKGYGAPEHFKFQRGAILDRDLSRVYDVNGKDENEIKEYISHSYYKYSVGDNEGLHPWKGETEFNYTGPKPPYEQLDVEGKYSWVKTPRWKGNAMEVGPLARALVGYAKGNAEVKEVVDEALQKLDVPVTALFSTLGRTAARGLETRLIARWAKGFYDDLIGNIKNGEMSTANTTKWDPATWPTECEGVGLTEAPRGALAHCEGVGLTEAPRGALAHWIRIKDRKINNYQLVVPSTWNASPRDAQGNRSAYEEALIGTPVAKDDEPLEIIRTIHSFDPCLACAVHLYDPDGNHVHQIQVN
jgi:hydrogenase large subunit